MNIAGLDLSLTSTGYCHKSQTLCIAPPPKMRGAERLSYTTREILRLSTENSIDCYLIEGYSFASRNSQAHSIGELGGCVRMALWENGIRYVEIPPTSRAKFATGKGNAGKNEVISSISAKTNIVWSGPGADDRCDAWILEQMGLTHLGLSEYQWPAVNMSALDKVDWSPMDGLTATNL